MSREDFEVCPVGTMRELEHLRAAIAAAERSERRMVTYICPVCCASLEATAQQEPAWLRVIDDAMVCSHLGVADANDDYATAKKKLNDLICWNIQVECELGHLVPQRELSDEELLGAIARGWCHEGNAQKVVDPYLAQCIAEEVRAVLRAAQEKA